MKKKFLHIDVETTGLDPQKNGIIQIAALYTDGIDGKVIDTFNDVCHAKGFDVDPVAMGVNGITKKDLKDRQSPKKLLKRFVKWMDKHIDRYDKKDKFTVVGYNVSFDTSFIFAWSKKLGYDYMGSYFNGAKIDVLSQVTLWEALNDVTMKSHKLKDACAYFGIADPGHDALADIEATRELLLKTVRDVNSNLKGEK